MHAKSCEQCSNTLNLSDFIVQCVDSLQVGISIKKSLAINVNYNMFIIFSVRDVSCICVSFNEVLVNGTREFIS